MTATRIAYVTDVEGNYDFFLSYIKLSDIIILDDKNNLQFRDDNTIFVYGGDVPDKGEGSIRITKLLVSFKTRYPERVFLILGNRDINKMRWTSELEKLEIENYATVPGPYWVKKEARVSPKEYLEKKLAEPGNKKSIQELNTIPNRIQWMLEATMGSAGDFERRRKELVIINKKKSVKDVSDMDVANSYIDSVKLTGEMFKFLSLGQLAYVHGETLFVHGGITKENIGYVPFQAKRIYNIHEWVKSLNAWYKSQFEEWVSQPTWSYEVQKGWFGLSKTVVKFDPSIQENIPTPEEYDIPSRWTARGGHRLLDYVVPTTIGSVVYCSMFNRFNNCQHVEPEVSKQLIDSNIRRVVTGHQPHGNAPAVSKDDDLELIDVDSSYSDMSASDNRGRAVSSLVIEARRVYVKGILQDGTAIDYSLSLVKGEGDPFVGRKVPGTDDNDGNAFWVKAKYQTKQPDGKEYTLCKVNGYKVLYDSVTKEKLEELFNGKSSNKKVDDIKQITVSGKPVAISKSDEVEAPLKEIVTVSFFDEWLKKMAKSELQLESIHVQSVDKLKSGFQIRFIKLTATVKDKDGDLVSGVTFLRGNSVAVFCVLTADDGKKYVVTIKHHRVPVGFSDFIEIPIGMEENSSPFGVIHNLLHAESGLELVNATTVNLSEMLFKDSQKVFYVSPGTCDQGVRYFLIESYISHKQLQDMETRSQSSVVPFETVLVPIEDLESVSQDANAVIAARLYELYCKQREITRQRLLSSDPSLSSLSSPPSPSLSPSLSAPGTPLCTSVPVPTVVLSEPRNALTMSSPALLTSPGLIQRPPSPSPPSPSSLSPSSTSRAAEQQTQKK